MSRAVAVLVLLGSALVAVLLPGATGASTAAPAGAGRTWVVDAVDGPASNVWESVDTGLSHVTIAVGDTVEWRFDRATQGHDLTSLAPSDAWESVWDEPLQVHREPGEAPVRVTFERPGTYRYWCSLHGTMMSGAVFVVDPGGNTAPVVDPVVEPTTVAVGQAVHATANATDPDGDVVAVSWDFGAGGAAALTDHAMHAYAAPGAYTARLRASDGRGGLVERDFPITVTGDPLPPDPDPPVDDGALPAIDALASPSSGNAPLAVAFSTQVTTTGTVAPFADAQPQDAGLTGTAVLVRGRGQTRTSLVVTGARAGAQHPVHVHEKPCDVDDGGAHFRFDTTQPFAEPNEIWPAFAADAAGASGPVEVVKPLRAGPLAVSVVVHDPTNPARRIGCADLAPATADLSYAWSFGDGTSASGPDPDHTYAAPGTYTATVIVARASGPHAGHGVSDSVQVVVGGGAAPAPTQAPAPVPAPAPAPAADTVPPRISKVGPLRAVRGARPTITARVRDRDSTVRRKDLVLRVDGRRVARPAYDARRGLVTWRPATPLGPGRHVVRLVVRDTAGNTARRTWWFRVR
ncbi:PKD repeat protein [Nocardioides cavernae]|uniref:PKD repeat protein n=1 Tax=Nocardioides cavernae TaxID=1921566 RepID=A0A7Y9KSD3_9ACTN|nr:PKD domain-containing protein [Nocardioides cavernae]NYE35713.1 PKD repeat protein [Nocardioides cavernae]